MKKGSDHKKFVFSLLLCIVFIFELKAQGIAPNKLVSRKKPAYTSNGLSQFLTDNQYGKNAWQVQNDSWIAFQLGASYDSVLISWNNPSYTWSNVVAAANSCKSSINILTDYEIQTSENSTNGQDGVWKTEVSIKNNTVTARGHVAVTKGATWIRLYITKGSGTLDEIEIYDLTESQEDLWLFVGTSITANTFKASPSVVTFADHIHNGHTSHYPAMIRAGIPCIASKNLINDIEDYFTINQHAKYWAIEMGSNDAWGGGNENVAAFKVNLQKVIDRCKSENIVPIVARMISTSRSRAGWQVHDDYLTAIDDLQTSNGLIEGPDFYSWFLLHPDHLNSDGVHPNDKGAAAIQRLWAESVVQLYGPADSTIAIIPLGLNDINEQMKMQCHPNPATDKVFIVKDSKTLAPMVYRVMDLNGREVDVSVIDHALQVEIDLSRLTNGIYFLERKNLNTRAITVEKLVVSHH
jgi:hypothetical protein